MQNFWLFLRRECRATPGRGSYTLRLTLSCAILIALFMTLQIPFLAVALIVVFYVSQPNVVMIKLAGIAFLVTVTFALGGVLLIIKWTYDYPLIRLVASVVLFFCAVYLMRVLGKLGLAFFVVALAVIYAQTFPSMTSQSEILVRLLLWLWVAINSAILVTVLVNSCFPQASPGYQLQHNIAHMFRQASALLAQPQTPLTLKDIAEQFLPLPALYKLACRTSPEVSANPQAWESLMAAAVRCCELATLLSPGVHPEQARYLSRVLSDVAEQAHAGKLPTIAPVELSTNEPQSVALQKIGATLNQLAIGDTVTLPAGEVEKEPLLAPDAWSNPAYLHFALKTLLATLLCYVFYTAADWQGIHTIMLSCVIVAQPGLGATLQKTWLRIGGALLATLLALFLMVFVQPHMDSLVGLLLMCLPVMALAAWLAAGSERIAYAGIQIGFTFALAFLNWFGPLSNLTELRDRVIGILLGVLVSGIVHLYLWPDSEAERLKSAIARLYRQAAQFVSAKGEDIEIMPLFQALPATESLMNRVAAEPLGTYAHPHPEAKSWPVQRAFTQLQEVVRLSEGYRLYAAPEDTCLHQCAMQLQAYADYIEQPQKTLPPVAELSADPMNPFAAPLTQTLTTLPGWPVVSGSIERQDN